MSGPRCVGIDVGSTYLKALVIELPAGGTTPAVVAETRRPTPWHDLAGGRSELDPAELADTVRALLSDVVSVAGVAGGRIAGIGVSGMAESGVLLDDAGRSQAPVLAWFDPRGKDEIEATPAAFRDAFPGTTGLPVSQLATIAKLLHLRGSGLELAGLTWLNVPEYVAWVLGGDRATEPSLASRTGLIDQETGAPWPAATEVLGLDEGVLPPLRTSGSRWGHLDGTGAVLTVAGHDHLVASVAAGVLDEGDLYDSIGTAEALIRPLTDAVGRADRHRLARAGINVTRHLLPGRSVMLAGAKTGLLLRRVLHLLGIEDAAGRDLLDKHVLRLSETARPVIDVSGADNGDGVLHVSVATDEVSPEELFAATLRHTTDEVARLSGLMATCVPPARRSVVSGGWSQMECVRAARRAVLPDSSFSARAEDTAFGAALIAAYAATAGPGASLVDFIRDIHHGQRS